MSVDECPDELVHDPLCFPAIRDLRSAMGVPSCFTCMTLRMAEDRGRRDERDRAADRVLQGVLVEGTPIFGCPVCPDIWESEPSCEHYGLAEKFAELARGPKVSRRGTG